MLYLDNNVTMYQYSTLTSQVAVSSAMSHKMTQTMLNPFMPEIHNFFEQFSPTGVIVATRLLISKEW